ncbi:MAG TPA: bifunctional phosphopantothenoylcysteine decarboxylase/phosphopantothenate--cysteine ligase CoaBC [Tepidisphaeraceae bacterium]|jgi:phosphopantothenoylcysteine decarboxylase/phosphopantothenate--cysteine ligase
MTPVTATPALPAKLSGRRIIVGVCGGIAVYKVADLVSRLVQAGATVNVVMTAEAQKFVTPLTFQALSGNPVRTDTFNLVESSDAQHIKLTEEADLMLVAPATTHMIAKIATGLTDDLVSLMVCAAACPVVFAPAMNTRMWEHPIAKENAQKLMNIGYRFIGPEAGWLACRNTGPGRLSDPATIVQELESLFLTLPPRHPQ